MNKFRFWNPETKEMIYDIHLKLDFGEIMVAELSGYISMLSTGLLDGNGKEIWEGDILDHDCEVKFGLYEDWGSEFIDYKNVGFYTSYPKSDYNEEYTMDTWVSEYKLVVGNIYENTEFNIQREVRA